MKVRPILRGLVSYIPLLNKILSKKGTGGSSSSEYCYSVWMRHLKYLESSGMGKIPEVVGELGPGDSLGIGIAALLSGARTIYALDIVRHTDLTKNTFVLNELLDLFLNKTPIPDSRNFKFVNPRVESTDLPYLIDQSEPNQNLQPERINEIRNVLDGRFSSDGINITYIVPWNTCHIIKANTCDLIYSQAVMEHVVNIEDAYSKMYYWLKPGGYISHQIDFKAHETHEKWYGHHTYSDTLWKIIMHGRKYQINRFSLSHHKQAIEKSGFDILKIIPVYSEQIPDKFLPGKNINLLTEEDKLTSSALIIAQKI